MQAPLNYSIAAHIMPKYIGQFLCSYCNQTFLLNILLAYGELCHPSLTDKERRAQPCRSSGCLLYMFMEQCTIQLSGGFLLLPDIHFFFFAPSNTKPITMQTVSVLESIVVKRANYKLENPNLTPTCPDHTALS